MDAADQSKAFKVDEETNPNSFTCIAGQLVVDALGTDTGMSGNEALVGEQLVRVQKDLNLELGAKHTSVWLVGNESPGIS